MDSNFRRKILIPFISLQSQKNALRRSLLSSIHGKRWNIEDERSKLNDVARSE